MDGENNADTIEQLLLSWKYSHLSRFRMPNLFQYASAAQPQGHWFSLDAFFWLGFADMIVEMDNLMQERQEIGTPLAQQLEASRHSLRHLKQLYVLCLTALARGTRRGFRHYWELPTTPMVHGRGWQRWHRTYRECLCFPNSDQRPGKTSQSITYASGWGAEGGPGLCCSEARWCLQALPKIWES